MLFSISNTSQTWHVSGIRLFSVWQSLEVNFFLKAYSLNGLGQGCPTSKWPGPLHVMDCNSGGHTSICTACQHCTQAEIILCGHCPSMPHCTPRSPGLAWSTLSHAVLCHTTSWSRHRIWELDVGEGAQSAAEVKGRIVARWEPGSHSLTPHRLQSGWRLSVRHS